jgi:hypothetical protein
MSREDSDEKGMVSLDGLIEAPNRELEWAIIDEELHSFVQRAA